jgi:hypothetical protein
MAIVQCSVCLSVVPDIQICMYGLYVDNYVQIGMDINHVQGRSPFPMETYGFRVPAKPKPLNRLI